MPARFGVVLGPSNDKGPFKLIRVRSEMREFTAIVDDPYGLVGNPVKGTLVRLDGGLDGGMETAKPIDLSKKRFDGLKAGEALFGNTETKTHVKLKENGDHDTVVKGAKTTRADANVETRSGGDTIIRSDGIVHINPPD
jgi:hypothetical protein